MRRIINGKLVDTDRLETIAKYQSPALQQSGWSNMYAYCETLFYDNVSRKWYLMVECARSDDGLDTPAGPMTDVSTPLEWFETRSIEPSNRAIELLGL